jgi:hypothetical protein
MDWMNRLRAALTSALAVLAWTPAIAQQGPDRFQLGGQVTVVDSSELNTTDVGFGARFSWNPIALLGAEAEFNFYPEDLGPDGATFSSARVEALFGFTVGPRIGAVRPFAKLRPGFVTFREAPQPFPCILIFPPPLACALGAGETAFALDLGGGVELLPAERMFFRVDLSDRMVRYPGPAFDSGGTAHEDAFYGHDFRFAAGAGVRF